MEDRVMRVLFRVIVSLGILLIPLVANSRAEDSEAEIRALKEQIEQIQRQNQQQIEELKKKIEQLETKRVEEQKKMEKIETKKETKEPEKEQWWNKAEAGYNQGFFIKTKDGNYTLKFWNLTQPQLFFEDKNDTKTVSFQILRERFIFSGNAVFPWLKYRLHFAADKGSGVTAKDIFIGLAYFEGASVRVGQFTVPFNRERATFDPYFEFFDRSIVSSQFDIERDIGAMVYGSLLNNILDYGVGVFNGAGPNVAQNPNGTNLLYTGRMVLYPFGKYNDQDRYFNMYNTYDYTQGDPIGLTTPLLAIGVGFAGLPNFNPNTEATTSRANLAKTILAINKNAQSADVFQFTGDITFKYYGFAFEAEYDLQRISGIVSGVPATNNAQTEQGLRLQAGYYFVPHELELAFRYGIVDKFCQNNIAKVGCQKEQEFTPGLNYLIHGYNAKISLNYSLLLQDNPAGGTLKDNRVFIQPQLWF
jgi:phosphate-selective porin OprO/OprP